MIRLLPWVACLTGLAAQFRFMIFSGFQQTHSGLGDARLVNFTLEHGYRWLRQITPHEDFWRPPILFPYPSASAFTDTMLGFAPPFWLARLLGAAPDTALQWWMLSIYALNFAAAYGLLRRGARLSVPASSAGALLLAVISVAWASHPQLFPFFYVLFAMLALFRIFDSGPGAPSTAARRVWIGVFCACGALQVWSAIYAAFFFGLLAGLAALVALAYPPTRLAFVQRVRRDAGSWLVLLMASAAVSAPLILRYQSTAEESGYRIYQITSVARPSSWLATGPGDPLLGRVVRGTGPLPARAQAPGLGLITFCVTAAGLLLSRRPAAARLIGLATLVMMALSTAYWGWSPWRWVHEFVPGGGGIRAHHRVTMILVPAAALGIGLVCERLLRGGRGWLALLLVSACVVERFHTRETIDKGFLRRHVAQIAERVDPEYEAFYLVGRHANRWVDEDAAWVAMTTGVPTVNGRYGNLPKGYTLGRRERVGGIDETREKLDEALTKWLDLWSLDRNAIQWIEYDSLTRAAVDPHRAR